MKPSVRLMFAIAAACSSTTCMVPAASASVDPKDQAMTDVEIAAEAVVASGVCDIQAIAFGDFTFNQQAQAQAKCEALIQQTFGAAQDCRVVRLNNGKRQAQFRRAFRLDQNRLQTLLQEAVVFIEQANVFANDQLRVQLQVSNGCGT